jgi:hypothetical protein
VKVGIDRMAILTGHGYFKDGFALLEFLAADVALGLIVWRGHDCGSVPAGVFQE